MGKNRNGPVVYRKTEIEDVRNGNNTTSGCSGACSTPRSLPPLPLQADLPLLVESEVGSVDSVDSASDTSSTRDSLPARLRSRLRIRSSSGPRSVPFLHLFPEKFRSSSNMEILSKETGTKSVEPASFFRASRFTHLPPTVRFCLPTEKVQRPRKSVCKMLQWSHNHLIPKVMRKTLVNSHFTIVHEKLNWIGYWGGHLKTSTYRSVMPFQKVNHFAGSFHLGRKDRLWKNMRHLAHCWGLQDFSLMPRTFVLPEDYKKLKAHMQRRPAGHLYILKPPASARGSGIRLLTKNSPLPKKEAVIVQEYISRPLLINGSKFDLRLYVYVSSFSPLRVYLYEDGLVRFASIKYSCAPSSVGNNLIHLTNYSINKSATGNEENRTTTGIKWSVRRLWKFLALHGHDVKALMERIVDLILKSLISCESSIVSSIRQNTRYPFTCHELFGYDIILDEQMKPWLLEVNISPSLHSGTPLDRDIKTPLARDLLNLAGIQLPEINQLVSKIGHCGCPRPDDFVNGLDFRCKTWDAFLSHAEREKQMDIVQHYLYCGKIKDNILEDLTPSDVRVLAETEDELDRRGQFTRIMPSPFSSRYLQYLKDPSYYNLLLDKWTTTYSKDRENGCAILERFCRERHHLIVPECKHDSELETEDTA